MKNLLKSAIDECLVELELLSKLDWGGGTPSGFCCDGKCNVLDGWYVVDIPALPGDADTPSKLVAVDLLDLEKKLDSVDDDLLLWDAERVLASIFCLETMNLESI